MNWDLTKLCKDKEDFEKKFDDLKVLIDKFPTFQSHLHEENKFKEYLLLTKEFEEKIGKPFMYASMLSDLDRRNVENQTLDSRVMMLYNRLIMNNSFAEPEILSIGKDVIMGFIDNNKDLEEFRFSINDMFRKNEHVLKLEEEQMLSNYNPLFQKASDLYNTLSISDHKNEHIKIDGKDVTVTQGNWRSLIIDSKTAKDRKKIFEALYKGYDNHKNTYANIYESILLGNKANAKVRKFDHILDSYLFDNNIPTVVFYNLVDVASKYNKGLKKYYKLRKKYLGLKHHYSYDRFLELAKSNKKFTYEEAKALYLDSIKDCPKDFIEKAKETLKDGYVDVMEKEGKRSGAYSSSFPNVHPFILLNFDGTLDSVFTLAHESGHSIHSLYSMENQPSTLQNYTIFVAEIASTFNEHMLLDYLMASGKLDKNDKIALLQKEIDEIVGTFYRQTLFANFELEANKLIENDEPINYEVLSGIMTKLYKKYYGLDLEKEPLKKLVWCYIPHMYNTPFYVYQYSTSFAASFKLYKEVKENKEEGFKNYLGLLKSGGSDYPINQTRNAGVDFTKKDAFLAVCERMNELVDELEKVLEE